MEVQPGIKTLNPLLDCAITIPMMNRLIATAKNIMVIWGWLPNRQRITCHHK